MIDIQYALTSSPLNSLKKLDQLSTIRASQRDSNSMALLVLEYENKLSHARRASKSDNRALQDAIAQAEQERVNLREELEVALDETRRAERERDTHLTALVEMTTQRDEWQSRSSTYKAKVSCSHLSLCIHKYNHDDVALTVPQFEATGVGLDG